MFQDDPLLRWATVIASIVVIAPMMMTPFLPLVDMGSNIGAAGLLKDVMLGRPVVSEHYYINWFPVPYWSGYLVMMLVSTVAGPFVAQKVLVGIVLVGIPVATMRLMHALGRSPRLGLCAFLLTWDVNLYWGWVSFQLGMVLALYGLARLAELSSFRQALALLPFSILIALSHAHAVLLLGLGGMAMAIVRPKPWQAVSRVGVVLLGTAITGLPWLLSRSSSAVHKSGLTYVSPNLSERIQKFYYYTLDNIHVDAFGETITGLAFLLLLLGPVALAAMKARQSTVPRAGAMALAFLLAALLPYLILPFEFVKPVPHWWNHPRFATYILLALLCLPAPDLRGRATWALAPAAIAFLVLQFAIVSQFRAYGAYTRPYLDIIATLPRASRFLPLDLADRAPGFRWGSVGQLHGFAAAATASFDPHLFDESNNPLQFRRNKKLPVPNWRRQRSTFSMEKQGRHYSHIIVHNLDQDPLVGRDDVTLMKESGPWRLYEVKKSALGGGS